MRKIVVLALVAVFAAIGVVASAQADKPATAGSQKCKAHNSGFNARGTLVSAALTPVGDGRYDGTIEVNVTKANHHAPTGPQTYTLDNARVKFHNGVDPAAPAPGSRVKLHGKITQLPKKCPTDGFTPTITIKKVDIKKAATP